MKEKEKEAATTTPDELMADADERMRGAVDSLDHDLAGFRTGRASTALVERLLVSYYGTPTPLNQLASLATPESRLITIRPWDAKVLQAIEKAIQTSDLGLTPSSDGQVIRLAIPTLTEQRRAELVKLTKKRVEEAHVAVRNVRRDWLHHLEQLDLPEDQIKRIKEKVQDLTNEFIKEIDQHGERKAAEILEV